MAVIAKAVASIVKGVGAIAMVAIAAIATAPIATGIEQQQQRWRWQQ